MDIWLFWPSSLPPPPAPRSDGLAAGLQSGASVPQLRAGRVCRPALQLLARLCSPRRWGEAIEDGARPPSHPPSKKKEDLGLNPDRLPLWHFKGLLSESVKKGSWRLCYFAKMQLAIPSFLLCSCDLFHHLNKYSNCFFFFFLWRVFILRRWGRLPQIRGSCAVFKQAALYTVLSPGESHISFRSQSKSFILEGCLLFL